MPKTNAEVREALNRLSRLEWNRLEAFAGWRIRGIGWRAAGRTGHDLFIDAIIATLQGTRQWNENVTFFVHLLGAIRSISTCWGCKNQPELVFKTSLSPTEPEDSGISEPASPAGDPEQVFAEQEELDQLRKLFAGDALALAVLDLLSEDCKPRDIETRLQLSQRECATILRRVRRRISAHLRRVTCIERRSSRAPLDAQALKLEALNG